jgi:hypothetical protein
VCVCSSFKCHTRSPQRQFCCPCQRVRFTVRWRCATTFVSISPSPSLYPTMPMWARTMLSRTILRPALSPWPRTVFTSICLPNRLLPLVRYLVSFSGIVKSLLALYGRKIGVQRAWLVLRICTCRVTGIMCVHMSRDRYYVCAHVA